MGLSDRWVYHDAHTGKWLGPVGDKGPALCKSTDLLLNLSGVNPVRPWFLDIPQRVLIDTDPAFTQIRHMSDPASRSLAGKHTAYFSFGENIGTATCSIPDDGIPWMTTRQPVVLDAWPVTAGPVDGVFTTVMQWDSYKPALHAGRQYGMKSASFTPYFDLPSHTESMLELCLGSPDAPRALLLDKKWRLSDALDITRSPWTYQQYIRSSKGEFTVAKQGYVTSRSGWFSERSAAYLASGRPVITQQTGFSEWLDTGSGVLAFENPGQALECLADVNARYRYHCRAAREVAEAYFDSRKVLRTLLDDIFSRRESRTCPR